MRWIVLAMIWVYQKTWTKYTPVCPNTPSCSELGKQAIREHGFRQGIIKTAEIIQTCGERRDRAQGDRNHLALTDT